MLLLFARVLLAKAGHKHCPTSQHSPGVVGTGSMTSHDQGSIANPARSEVKPPSCASYGAAVLARGLEAARGNSRGPIRLKPRLHQTRLAPPAAQWALDASVSSVRLQKHNCSVALEWSYRTCTFGNEDTFGQQNQAARQQFNRNTVMAR